MSDMIVRSSAGSGLAINEGKSVLGERQARIPVGGKIRPGIKVLTGAAKSKNGAQEIYDRGLAAGKDWGQIEKELREKLQFQKSPLTPRNVPWFTVRRSDFKVPQAADQIMDLYGEDYEGERRLIQFPVVFPTDSWQANMPHSLKTYTRNELVFWSDYDQDGTRRCYTKKSAQSDSRNRRAHRPFGGRPTVLRDWNNGICDPEKCPEYQTRKCNLSGQMLFFIPGVQGSSAISIPTTSFYAMDQAREKMEMVAYLRGGRISGTHDGKPIFYITKAQQEVSMLDPETGEPKRVKQWLVTLEADIDMLQVFQAAEKRLAHAGQDGADAAQALEHRQPDQEPEFDHEPATEPEFRDTRDDIEDAEVIEPEAEAPDPHQQIKALRKVVADKLGQAEIEPGVFSDYAARQTEDPNWGKTLEGLQWADNELDYALQAEDLEAWKSERELDAPF